MKRYRASASVEVLVGLAVAEIGVSTQHGVIVSLMALIDYETQGLYSDQEIRDHTRVLLMDALASQLRERSY